MFKEASKKEKQAVAELCGILRKKLMSLHRAEGHRKEAREQARRCASYISNPSGFTGQNRKQKTIRVNTEAGKKACRRLWIQRSDSWANATTQAENQSLSAWSPGRGCLMFERPKTPSDPA
ncbi:hypothetical protein P4O66_013430 [Electrophorus voltai]|uniref:Uncharacterized protein n=1 Tax=Electrophorus voltai TaxID=2609070 RepID=A0AAD8Z2E5_9TELE|nr:hypothetical protein P4O66_013430 [Electrophorus voltai]